MCFVTGNYSPSVSSSNFERFFLGSAASSPPVVGFHLFRRYPVFFSLDILLSKNSQKSKRQILLCFFVDCFMLHKYSNPPFGCWDLLVMHGAFWSINVRWYSD